MKKTAAIAVLLTCTSFHSFRINAEPASTTSSVDEETRTSQLLQSIRSFINDAVDIPQNTGNYRLFKSGTELKSIIDTWEKANANLSDKTFRELDQSQQQFFDSVYTAATELNQDTAAQMGAATIIAKVANQAIEDPRLFDGKLALFQYSPRIVYPGMSKVVSFTIRGNNFDISNPRITLPNGESASRVSLSKHEAVFSVPSSVFKFEPLKTEFVKLKLSYQNSKKKREKTDITVLQLPLKISDFTLQIRTQDTMRDTWEGKRQFYWSGREASKTLSQGPHDNGWRIDVSSLRQGRVWGEAGKGCFITSNNEHGFAIEVRIEAVRTGLNPDVPAYQYCEWQWEEYLDKQVISQQPPISGQINWSKDVSVSLPVNTASISLRVKTWDSIERVITGSQAEPFYRVVYAGDFLVIKPQFRADLNEP